MSYHFFHAVQVLSAPLTEHMAEPLRVRTILPTDQTDLKLPALVLPRKILQNSLKKHPNVTKQCAYFNGYDK